ncbi:hypothetical protein [Cysteiniphilum sp. QT6929]|uniref:hypothetical protein n=1 Tax=Cysteiniphilum sp. QT6929 TaxID=2975055 RepID=UPI0024B33E68|nr:hypothetical protein [Cysteiniphilum sp. QT6929]WHN65303.1 hypothetical protein NYP54_09680 [Cysteiniphilum sp. QT6929]
MKGVKKLVTAIAVMGFVNCYAYAADLNSQSMNAGQTVSTAVAQLGKGVPVAASTDRYGSELWTHPIIVMHDGSTYEFDTSWNFKYHGSLKNMTGYPKEKGIPVAGFATPGYDNSNPYVYYIFPDGSMYKSRGVVYGYSWFDTQKNLYDMEGYPLAKGLPVAAFEWGKASDSFRMIILADGSVYRFDKDWKFEADPGLAGGNIKNAPYYPKDKGVPVAAYQSPNKQNSQIYFIFADGSHYKIDANARQQWRFIEAQPNSIYQESGYPRLTNGLKVDLSLEHDMSVLGGTYKIYNNSKNQARLKVKASVYSENEFYERTYYDFDISQLMGALTLYDQQDDMKPQHFSLQRNEYFLGTFNQTRALSSTVELGELVNYELKSSDKIEKSGYIYFTSAAEQYHLYNLCIKYMEDKDRSNGGSCNKQTTLVEGKVPLSYDSSMFSLIIRGEKSADYIDTINTYTFNSSVLKRIHAAKASSRDSKIIELDASKNTFQLRGSHVNGKSRIILVGNEQTTIPNPEINDNGCIANNFPLTVEDMYGNTSTFPINFGYGYYHLYAYNSSVNMTKLACYFNW